MLPNLVINDYMPTWVVCTATQAPSSGSDSWWNSAADALGCGGSTTAVLDRWGGADGAAVGWWADLAPSAREWCQTARWEEQAHTACLSSWIVTVSTLALFLLFIYYSS